MEPGTVKAFNPEQEINTSWQMEVWSLAQNLNNLIILVKNMNTQLFTVTHELGKLRARMDAIQPDYPASNDTLV